MSQVFLHIDQAPPHRQTSAEEGGTHEGKNSSADRFVDRRGPQRVGGSAPARRRRALASRGGGVSPSALLSASLYLGSTITSLSLRSIASVLQRISGCPLLKD